MKKRVKIFKLSQELTSIKLNKEEAKTQVADNNLWHSLYISHRISPTSSSF